MSVKYTAEVLKGLRGENNRLTFVDFDKSEKLPCGESYKKIICQCICGNVVSVSLYHFVNNKTKSCGCYRVHHSSAQFKKFHPIVPGIYSSYRCMMSRCYSKNHPSYANYGGRGIVVCDEWRTDYQSFLNWALQNGWREGLELDKDSKGTGLIYSPESCCWITKLENNSHRRDLKRHPYGGKLLTLAEVSRMENISYATLSGRLKKKVLSLDEIVSIIKNPNK